MESLEVCNKLTQLPRASKPSVIFQRRSCPFSGPAIVSAAFVTDGVWPTGLQLAHLVALKPLGAWRKHMGRISWHQHLRVLERACFIAPARRAWNTSTINLFHFSTFSFALKLTSTVSVCIQQEQNKSPNRCVWRKALTSLNKELDLSYTLRC